MSAREEISAAADTHGWRLHDEPADLWETYEYRRTRHEHGRQRTEYIKVTYDVRNRVLAATWAPSLDGVGARRPLIDKVDWVLDKLAEARPTTEQTSTAG